MTIHTQLFSSQKLTHLAPASYPLYSRRLPATQETTKIIIIQPFLHQNCWIFLYHDHPGSVVIKTYTILIQPAAHSFYSCFFPALPAAGKWREGGWEAGIKDLKFTGPCLWTLVTNSKKKSARLVPKWPSYVNSVFLRWRVAAGAAGKRREAG